MAIVELLGGLTLGGLIIATLKKFFKGSEQRVNTLHIK